MARIGRDGHIMKQPVHISGASRLAGTAHLPQEGTYTATETGAREAAEIKHRFQMQREMLNSAGEGTKAFEDVIRKEKP
jgi:hypothetical protein